MVLSWEIMRKLTSLWITMTKQKSHQSLFFRHLFAFGGFSNFHHQINKKKQTVLEWINPFKGEETSARLRFFLPRQQHNPSKQQLRGPESKRFPGRRIFGDRERLQQRGCGEGQQGKAQKPVVFWGTFSK